MTQLWRGRLDTSSLAIRAIACALLLLVLGSVGPKRKAAAPGFAPRLPFGTAAKDARGPSCTPCVVGSGRDALLACD
jgi:hypothetical protein